MAGDLGSDLKSAQGVGLQHFLPSALGSPRHKEPLAAFTFTPEGASGTLCVSPEKFL